MSSSLHQTSSRDHFNEHRKRLEGRNCTATTSRHHRQLDGSHPTGRGAELIPRMPRRVCRNGHIHEGKRKSEEMFEEAFWDASRVVAYGSRSLARKEDPMMFAFPLIFKHLPRRQPTTKETTSVTKTLYPSPRHPSGSLQSNTISPLPVKTSRGYHADIMSLGRMSTWKKPSKSHSRALVRTYAYASLEEQQPKHHRDNTPAPSSQISESSTRPLVRTSTSLLLWRGDKPAPTPASARCPNPSMFPSSTKPQPDAGLPPPLITTSNFPLITMKRQRTEPDSFPDDGVAEDDAANETPSKRQRQAHTITTPPAPSSHSPSPMRATILRPLIRTSRCLQLVSPTTKTSSYQRMQPERVASGNVAEAAGESKKQTAQMAFLRLAALSPSAPDSVGRSIGNGKRKRSLTEDVGLQGGVKAAVGITADDDGTDDSAPSPRAVKRRRSSVTEC